MVEAVAAELLRRGALSGAAIDALIVGFTSIPITGAPSKI
jgi:hypothetical protein